MIRIYTMTHKKFMEPQNTIYIPLHVGRNGNSDLGYQGDDTGTNISAKNKYYGELTGVYWVWKNDRESDLVGICHYRRFFMDEQGNLLGEAQYQKLLGQYDMIVSKAMEAPESYEAYYGEAHNPQDLQMVGTVIRERYPEQYPVYQEVMAGKKYYYGNLMVTSKALFDAYCVWLFSILFEVEKRIDVSSYDMYNQRVFGFLSEQMLYLWIRINQLKVCECRVGITAEKAETVELKLAMGQLLKMGQISQARQMFYEFIKLRPDVCLELSDIKGELPGIEQILYICELEQEQHIEGMLAYSKNLPQLLEHVKELQKILLAAAQGKFGAEQEQYLMEKQVAWVPLAVLMKNMVWEPGVQRQLKEKLIAFFKKNHRETDAEKLQEI